MSLTSSIHFSVQMGVRSEGDRHFQNQAVAILDGDDWTVDATVRDRRSEEVALIREDKAILKGWCTCTDFRRGHMLCSHLWAVMRKVEQTDYLKGSYRVGPYRFKADTSGLAEYDADDEFDSDDPEENGMYEDHGEAVSFGNGPVGPAPVGFLRFPSPAAPTRRGKKAPNWKQSLMQLRSSGTNAPAPSSHDWLPGREILYIVEVPTTVTARDLGLEVAFRERKKNGDWTKPKSQRLSLGTIASLPDLADRKILSLLKGPSEQVSYGYYHNSWDTAPCRYVLSPALQDSLLPLVCATGRARLRLNKEEELRDLHWDDGPAWELWLHVQPETERKTYHLGGDLRRGQERLNLDEAVLLLPGGLVFWNNRVGHLQDFGAFEWIGLLRQQRFLPIPAGQIDAFLKEFFSLPHLPRLDLPPEMLIEEIVVAPRPSLKVKLPDRQNIYGRDLLLGELTFDYEGERIELNQPGQGIYQIERRRRLLRDLPAEQAAFARLRQLGFRYERWYGDSQSRLQLTPTNLPKVVRTLLGEQWTVEAEGKLYRQHGNFDIEVVSGIDWFDLQGTVDFEGRVVKLPALLEALRKGEDIVRLDDGTFGLLPEDWLKKYGLLAGLGKEHEGNLRFSRTQVGLLDALLAAQPDARWDEGFADARNELRSFEGIAPAAAPDSFAGELRAYQNDGLGWLQFLQKFRFGGCLADDMGLGKTVQVLALLESRRRLRTQTRKKDRPAPSLVVVPRSLVFNWKQEAARFTPQLRVLDHSGTGRGKPGAHFHDFDLILTTYGTLRRDAADLNGFAFDYCILDEAQAIKNAKSESAKAARLIQARHRLAMSGTPIENHLGELWSLFEFLNPGMLGNASVFQLTGAGARNPSVETRSLLSKALRPFLLRRTKQQVAKDLPAKLEQTIWCELEPSQRKLYDELRDFYRASLLNKIEKEGWNKAKIQVLEALLRLRQAACHPGLLDMQRATEPSAKLDVLLPQLAQVTEEGHKALVFSQFTSFLALVRHQLDKDSIPYEYLDGRTRNRGDKVARFQNDSNCKLFLISLKAGGLGLNLTAAEYVFLLDPWWNPAVEAQAIDRTHRIGQTEQVFAYRLIARNTVEEKVLELQQKKRDLADAIINADNSLLRDLKREDLELLLS